MNKDATYYWLRRLHSLTGVVPVGAFLLEHLYTNFTASPLVGGPMAYQKNVDWILDQPLLPLLEWGAVFLPLLFHSVLGVFYSINAKPNPSVYRYQKNAMYTLQRVTGLITLAFVVAHVATTRFSFDEEQKRNAFLAMVEYFKGSGLLFIGYCIGVMAASFHFANGLWGFCIMWGITITRKSQDLVFKAVMGLFVALSFGGVMSAVALTWPSNDALEQAEQLRHEYRLKHNLPDVAEGDAQG